jgi:hypothetical protein
MTSRAYGGDGTGDPGATRISASNSSTTLLAAGATFTGTAEDVTAFNSVMIAVKTDQDGTYTVQFSNDGTNWDSTLTRYFRLGQIDPPHRFTVTRQYCRVTFTNTSASPQTYLRLQTTFGTKSDLNAPIDTILAKDFDSISVRPTSFETEVALGRRQGSVQWTKFGYNTDVDTASAEIIAEFGGTFNPMTTARTLSFVSTSSSDTLAGTGARQLVVYGVDQNRDAQTVVVDMNGTTPVVTTSQWLGVNRVAIYTSGSASSNVGKITATATTDLTIQATMPTGEGTSQQALYFTPRNTQALVRQLFLAAERLSGSSPKVIFRGWVYSAVTNARYLILRDVMDTAAENHLKYNFDLPLIIGERSALWFTAETTANDTQVAAKFSLLQFDDVDA